MIDFEKVSKEQYIKDSFGDTKFSKEMLVAIMEEYDNIKLPQRATKGSAGYDFFSPVGFTLQVGETIKLPTGIRFVCDELYDVFLMILPRSGHGFKYRIQLDNTAGIVDEDFFQSDNQGHIFIKLTNDGKCGLPFSVKAGDAIAQGIITPFIITTTDQKNPVTKTRNGGFGSTDKK